MAQPVDLDSAERVVAVEMATQDQGHEAQSSAITEAEMEAYGGDTAMGVSEAVPSEAPVVHPGEPSPDPVRVSDEELAEAMAAGRLRMSPLLW